MKIEDLRIKRCMPVGEQSHRSVLRLLGPTMCCRQGNAGNLIGGKDYAS